MIDRNEIATPSQYLTFIVAEEEYAVGILRVKEIIAYDTVTRVPTTPRYIRGVINLRGSVVPIVDVAMKFGIGDAVISKSSCIVIVEVGDGDETAIIGLLVDAVQQVIDLAPSDIEPPPQFGLRMSVDFIIGLAQASKKFVIVLDIDRVVTANEVVTAVAAADAAEPVEELAAEALVAP